MRGGKRATIEAGTSHRQPGPVDPPRNGPGFGAVEGRGAVTARGSRWRPARWRSTAQRARAASIGAVWPSRTSRRKRGPPSGERSSSGRRRRRPRVAPSGEAPEPEGRRRGGSRGSPARAGQRKDPGDRRGATQPRLRTAVATTGSGFHDGPPIGVQIDRCATSRPQTSQAHGSKAMAAGRRRASAESADATADHEAGAADGRSPGQERERSPVRRR